MEMRAYPEDYLSSARRVMALAAGCGSDDAAETDDTEEDTAEFPS